MNQLYEALHREANRFGPSLARQAYAQGLAVTAKDGSTRPIPITATPMVIDAAHLSERAALSALLASAGAKMAHAVLQGDRPERLLGALSPLERQVAQQTFASARRLATTRVDYFIDQRGLARALELNATIPAMQGYSDIAAQTFVAVVGAHFGLPAEEIAKLQELTPSNARALHQALLQGFAQVRGGARPSSIGLLCRRNDAQITEQRYLRERFRQWGHQAEVIHPDELVIDEGVSARGQSFDLIYRHLFVRRLEEPDLAGADQVKRLLLEVPSRQTVVLNPPASQVEVKTAFALLSEALNDPALARAAQLTDEELTAIAHSIPWTRSFRRGPGTDPDGTRVADLVERVIAEPAQFVLKRAWDYGGRAVFVGRTIDHPSFDERVIAAYGRSLSWGELCARTASDAAGGGFVVQQIVDSRPEAHLLCTEEASTPVDLYVDFSAYASVGLEVAPRWGGVCRGSPSHIVNIVGGGGVLPLITTEVAKALTRAANGGAPR